MPQRFLPFALMCALLIGSAQQAVAAPQAERGVSVTTGWRSISGWEANVVKKDANLKRWHWLPMREMNKAYVKFPPRKLPPKSGMMPKPRYNKTPARKPIHVPTRVVHKPAPRPANFVNLPPRAPRYVRPNHVATVVPPPKMNTYIKLSAPRTEAAVAVPRAEAALAAPSTSARLIAARPPVKPPAAKPAPKIAAPPPDAMAEVSDPRQESDAFSEPDPYKHNVYGLVRRPVASAADTSSTRLKGRLMKPKKKS